MCFVFDFTCGIANSYYKMRVQERDSLKIDLSNWKKNLSEYFFKTMRSMLTSFSGIVNNFFLSWPTLNRSCFFYKSKIRSLFIGNLNVPELWRGNQKAQQRLNIVLKLSHNKFTTRALWHEYVGLIYISREPDLYSSGKQTYLSRVCHCKTGKCPLTSFTA